MIGFPAGGEHLGPAVLGVPQHQRDKFSVRIVWRAGLNRWSGTRLLGRRTDTAEQVENYVRIDAKIPANQADDDDGADTETAAPAWHTARCARLAIVFDVAAGTKIICAHLSFSNRVPVESQAAASIIHLVAQQEKTILGQKRFRPPCAERSDVMRID